MDKDFFIRFWGVRGSVPTPGPHTIRYGGETTCFEIRVGKRVFLIDAGTGVRNAGVLLKNEGFDKFDVFFSHFHLDHLIGLPFLNLIYDDHSRITCHSNNSSDGLSLSEVIGNLFAPPIYPIPVAKLKSIEFNSIEAGNMFNFSSEFQVQTIALHHPDECCGFKFIYKNKAICIISDHEHGDSDTDLEIESFVKNADIMVYDGMFSDEEYGNFVGWGHSTWQEGIRLAEKMGVKKVVITHHSPSRTDENLDEFAKSASKVHRACLFAQEGMVLEP